MNFLIAFVVGGIICSIGQILIDRTSLTPAKILTGYVLFGFLLQVFGLYQPLVDFAGRGATVPLTGFGYLLAKGVSEGYLKDGFFGAVGGGLISSSIGIATVIFIAILSTLFFKPKGK